MKRTFIAIPITPSPLLSSAIADIKERLKDSRIRWARPEGLHVTLAFIGQTSADNEIRIKEILSSLSHEIEPFSLAVESIGAFGKSTPKVLWVGITDINSSLNAAVTKLKARLSENGIVVDSKPFTPHLTLGRIKELQAPEFSSMLAAYTSAHFQAVEVNEIAFYNSISQPNESPIYQPISKVKLG